MLTPTTTTTITGTVEVTLCDVYMSDKWDRQYEALKRHKEEYSKCDISKILPPNPYVNGFILRDDISIRYRIYAKGS